jgi:hypothetical protein
MLCIGEEDTPISLEFERRGEKNSYETFKVTLRRTGQLLREVLNIKYLCICFNLFTSLSSQISQLIGISIPFTLDIHIFPSTRNGSFHRRADPYAT